MQKQEDYIVIIKEQNNMDMKNILNIIDGKVGSQTSGAGKEDMKRFMSIVSDVPTLNREDAAAKLLRESIGEAAYEHPAGKELARLGRILMDRAAVEKNDELSNVMARVGDELTRFGVAGGAKSTEELTKKAGVSLPVIGKLMTWASKQKDTTLDVVDEPEELEVGNDFDSDDEKIIDVGDSDEEDEVKIGEMSFADYYNLAEAAARLK